MAKPTADKPRPRRRPAAGAEAPAAAAAGPALRVRMYRQGLGDCFLVSLLSPGCKPFHLMIDCGVILGTSEASELLRTVIRDVIRETGGKIDVLVVTHEHYDHVAGFILAEELFARGGDPAPAGKLSVGKVWFGWTEDPGNKDAERLRKARAERLASLSRLTQRLTLMGAMDSAVEGRDALRFFGVGEDGKLGATAQAMANAARLVDPGSIRYWNPGDIWESPDAPGLRIYVLGPPKADAALKKRDSASEVYHLALGPQAESVRWLGADAGSSPELDRYAPFERGWYHPLSDIAAGRHSGEVTDFLAERYYGPNDLSPAGDIAWRQIETDWLGGAEAFGLALDSATNNTSLALAIELTESGKVLLFPGDAQVGSWLAWEDLSWDRPGYAKSVEDLLSRTVFYKVGHHGSHNATLRQKGLEKMPAAGLTAFLPVDRNMALQKRWGRMPLPSLIDALKQRCGPNLIRMDEALPAGSSDVQAGPSTALIDPLYYEWRLAL